MPPAGVLDKVVAILDCFPDGSTRLEPRDVAARLGITTPTAYRLMKGMAGHGLLERDAGGYRLGVALLHLGARVAAGLDVRQVARPHLQVLRDRTSENAELHVRHGETRVPIEVLASPLHLRPIGQVGVPLPLHVGASAQVLLAWLPADEGAALARASHAHASDTSGPGNFDALGHSRRLARVRRQGWAASDGERETGVASVAAPVRDRSGAVVAAMVVSAPSARLRPASTRGAVVAATTAAATAVSYDLGHVDRSTQGETA